MRAGKAMYEELYENNIGILKQLTRHYAGACMKDNAIEPEDLFQAGFIGLIGALKAFNEKKARGEATEKERNPNGFRSFGWMGKITSTEH